MRSLVIIPTYNEIENIDKMLETVVALDPAFDVLVVDDGSPDGQQEPFSRFKMNTRIKCTCFNEPGSSVWERPTSRAFAGR